MDLRFGLIVIFLILDVSFVWATNDKSSGGISLVIHIINRGNLDSSKKKKNSTKVELSTNIVNNPFLQSAIQHRPNLESNPFLYSSSGYNNQNQTDIQQTVFLPQENSSSSVVTFVISNNPFLNQDSNTRINDTATISWLGTYTPAPIAQTPRPPAPVAQTPRPPAPVAQRPKPSAPLDNHSFTFPNKVQPSGPGTLPDLTSLTFGLKTKSESKCDEYVREIVGTKAIAPLVGESVGVIKINNVCGDVNRLVVGGTEAKVDEFPHMVALGRRNFDQTFRLICGASLISHTWVLTAAHCTHGPNGAPSDARIGFHRLTDQQSGVTIAIKNMIRHPDYTPPKMYADIALIELVSAVTFTASIRPACLYQQYDSVPQSAWISGWGVTEFAGDQSDRLQKAQLDLVDNLVCTIAHNNSLKEVPRGVTPNMVCAGNPRGGWTIDTCQGDSGGPLQVINPKNQCLFQVIGITSFGQGCAIINSPGVYTRVSHYIPWIESTVWP